MINPNVAIGAYSNTANISGGNGGGVKVMPQDDGVSFSDLLQQTVSDSIDTMKAGEEMSARAVTGDADITDVVGAVTAAEVTLQTVVAVRDRLVSVYQDIIRMPI